MAKATQYSQEVENEHNWNSFEQVLRSGSTLIKEFIENGSLTVVEIDTLVFEIKKNITFIGNCVSELKVKARSLLNISLCILDAF